MLKARKKVNELLIVQMRKGRYATIQGLHIFKSFYPVPNTSFYDNVSPLFNDQIVNK